MLVDLNALRILEAIMTHGSFAKAAASLNKTQAAISYKIKKLEEQLNVTIFNRQNYRAELTPAGLIILEEGRRLLHHSERIRAIAQSLNQDWEPYLQIILDGAVPMDPVMRALKEMVDRSIPTRVQIKVEFLSGVQACFEADGADIMIAREFDDDPFYLVDLLPELEFLLCVSREHPLADRDEVSAVELREYVKLTIKDSRTRVDISDKLAATDGNRAHYLSDFAMKKRAILMGLGYGWMPTYLVKEELVDGRLRLVNYVNGCRYTFQPKLITRLNRHFGKAGQLLKRELLAHYAAFVSSRP